MDLGLLASQLGHTAAALCFGYPVFASYRWIRRQSALLGAVVAAAILVRLALGVSLFSISYFELPIAQSLQVKGGFWLPALDATGYFQMAAKVADTWTMAPVDGSVPSPFFVNALGVWMFAVGISPAAGVFFNLCLYVLLAVVVVRLFAPVNDWRRDLPCIVAIVAYSFSPVIVFNSTQPLKDELSGALVAIACFGVHALRGLVGRRTPAEGPWIAAGGAVTIASAIFAMGGVRWYHSIILLCSLALVLSIFAVRGRTTPLLRYLAGSFVVLSVSWLACWGAAPQSMRQLAPDPVRIAELPSELLSMAQIARSGFLTSGGASNIVVPLHDDPAAGQAEMARVNAVHKARAAYTEMIEAMKQEQSNRSRATGIAGTDPRASDATGLETADMGAVRGATTSLQSKAAPTGPAGPAPEARAIPVTIVDHIRTVAAGLAIVFVPASLIEAISSVEIQGGRGLMSIVDLDTLFLDASILAVLTLLWQRRHAIDDRMPLVMFALILSATTAIILGYVVTNFGTLWRMRPLIAIPIWMSVVALARRAEVHQATCAPPGAAS